MTVKMGLCTTLRHYRRTQTVTFSRMSSTFSNITLDLNKEKGVGVLTLKRPPVNSLDLTTLEDFVRAVDSLENDLQFRGLIITSNVPGVFSAGLDINEMYKPDVSRLKRYWSAVQEWWLRLYGSKLAVISAINGHSPGGGCMMALCSDYRMMAHGPFTIGLNETSLGIAASTWSYFMAAMVNVTGHRTAERSLQLGQLYSADQALAAGIVDELVKPTDLLSGAHAQMEHWLRIPDVARQTTKQNMRLQTLNLLTAHRVKDVEAFVDVVTSKPIQKNIAAYIQRLSKPSGG